MKLTATIKTQSDWHVGSGTGQPGHIDALVARDSDGLPFIPAKTLQGVWRDACERVAFALDGGPRGTWNQLVEFLFGSQPSLHRGPTDHPPQPAALSVRPARLPAPLRALLIRHRAAAAALTFVKPGVKISDRTGQAVEDYLRFEELARVGAELEAEVELDVPPDVEHVALALLVAGAHLVDRLGGKRRRGHGRCQIELRGDGVPNMGQAVETLRKARREAVSIPLPTPEPKSAGEAAPVAAPAQRWFAIPLRIKPLAPLAISYRTVGNVVETLDYVPGYCLLPHVTAAVEAMGVSIRPFIVDGLVRVLNATIEESGVRALPAPEALEVYKDSPGFACPRKWVVNRFLTGPDNAVDGGQSEERDAGRQTKPARGVFLAWDGDGFLGAARVPLTVRTHGSVDDVCQRPTREAGGGVYSYEAIAAAEDGQPVYLRSVLVVNEAIHSLLSQRDPQWWRRLNGTARVGRSKKDDYGMVEIEVGEPCVLPEPPAAPDDELFVWLVSDTLLRDDGLRYAPLVERLRHELETSLDVGLSLRDARSAFARTRRHETWHSGWQLPRPSLIALRAGSCFVFRADGPIDPARLAQLQAAGLGDRTAEGFGEVLFNHPILTRPPRSWNAGQATAEADPATGGGARLLKQDEPGFQLARLLEREVAKRLIRRRCLEIADKSEERRKLLGWKLNGRQSEPTITQIMAFRQVLARLHSQEDRRIVSDWFSRLEKSKLRKEAWPADARSKCLQLVQDDNAIWEALQLEGNWEILTEDGLAALQRDLWGFAVRALVDACARAHKRQSEPSGEQT